MVNGYKASQSAAAFLDALIADMGLYTERERQDYLAALNEVICFLYTAVLCLQESVDLAVEGNSISYAALREAPAVQRTDILSLYEGERPLYPLPIALLPLAFDAQDRFYTAGQDGILLSQRPLSRLRISFLYRPMPITAENEADPLPLPDEFLPAADAFVRGKIYRLVNEDELAAKWLSVYNTALQDIYAYTKRGEGA